MFLKGGFEAPSNVTVKWCPKVIKGARKVIDNLPSGLGVRGPVGGRRGGGRGQEK